MEKIIMIEKTDFSMWKAQYRNKQGNLVKMVFDTRKAAQAWLFNELKQDAEK